MRTRRHTHTAFPRTCSAHTLAGRGVCVCVCVFGRACVSRAWLLTTASSCDTTRLTMSASSWSLVTCPHRTATPRTVAASAAGVLVAIASSAATRPHTAHTSNLYDDEAGQGAHASTARMHTNVCARARACWSSLSLQARCAGAHLARGTARRLAWISSSAVAAAFSFSTGSSSASCFFMPSTISFVLVSLYSPTSSRRFLA